MWAQSRWRSRTWFEQLRGCEGAECAGCAPGCTAPHMCLLPASGTVVPCPGCRCLFLALFIISLPIEIKMNPSRGHPPLLPCPAAALSQANGAGGGGSVPQGQGRLRGGFVLTLSWLRMRWEPPASHRPAIGCAAGLPTICRDYLWCTRLGFGAHRGSAGTPRCATRWWTSPKDTWRGRVQHPERKGDVLCRGCFGSSVG